MIYTKRVYFKTNHNILNQNSLVKIKNLLLDNDIIISKLILFVIFLTITILINSMIFYFYRVNFDRKSTLLEEINKLNIEIENKLNKKESLLNDKKIRESILKKGYTAPDERQIVRLKE